jgi:hypothetical protein
VKNWREITLKSIIHVIISFILTIILFFLNFPIESCVFCFLIGVFIDFDHYLDFLLWSEDKNFKKFSILGPPYFVQSHYTDTLFHSIDLFIILAVLIATYVPSILGGIIIGFASHLVLDYLGYGFTPFHFFLLYRVVFEKRKERELRDDIFKKDGFKCVECGVTQKLQIHRALNQESWDTRTEWMTLCEECHIKHHGSGQFY